MRRVAFVLVALVAVLMAGSAGAYFTGQAQVPENMVRAGGITISTEPTSSALSVDSLLPGIAVSRPLTVVNDGSLPASVTITAVKKAGITEFWDALTVRAMSSGQLLYDGPMNVMRTSPMTLAPGARVNVDFAMAVPATAGNELASDYAKFTLYVDAEQVH
ncbi:MAG TPA: TasA family protein [Coriobacteriia bacterium]